MLFEDPTFPGALFCIKQNEKFFLDFKNHLKDPFLSYELTSIYGFYVLLSINSDKY